MTEDELVGWHHQLNGHEFEQTLGNGEGQGRLAYCGPWGCRELDVSERLNNNSDLLLSVGVQDGSLLVLLSVINTEMA